MATQRIRRVWKWSGPLTCGHAGKHRGRGLCNGCYRKAWRSENPEAERAIQKRSTAKRKGKHRASMLLKNFGMTEEQYEVMFEKQGGLCAICGNSWIKRRLAVDHDHDTGKLRELLCGRCNGQLGWLEKKDWYLKAMAYLEKHKCQ